MTTVSHLSRRCSSSFDRKWLPPLFADGSPAPGGVSVYLRGDGLNQPDPARVALAPCTERRMPTKAGHRLHGGDVSRFPRSTRLLGSPGTQFHRREGRSEHAQQVYSAAPEKVETAEGTRAHLAVWCDEFGIH